MHSSERCPIEEERKERWNNGLSNCFLDNYPYRDQKDSRILGFLWAKHFLSKTYSPECRAAKRINSRGFDFAFWFLGTADPIFAFHLCKIAETATASDIASPAFLTVQHLYPVAPGSMLHYLNQSTSSEIPVQQIVASVSVAVEQQKIHHKIWVK